MAATFVGTLSLDREVDHTRRGSPTMGGVSCLVRTGSHNYCKEFVVLSVHRAQPKQRIPRRSSVRTAKFVVPCICLALLKYQDVLLTYPSCRPFPWPP